MANEFLQYARPAMKHIFIVIGLNTHNESEERSDHNLLLMKTLYNWINLFCHRGIFFLTITKQLSLD